MAFLDRRRFLQSTAIATLGLGIRSRDVAAQSPNSTSWGDFIPPDKKLHPDWVGSLFERGSPGIHRKSRNELRFIGMPVGGICCGTLYLGGDGRLWNWDIFNQKTEGVLPRRVSWSEVGMDFQTGDNAIRPRDGATYVRPAVQSDSQSIAQGFALRIQSNNGFSRRALAADDWQEVTFLGQYPIGTVEYSDPGCPISVRMEAFSPFIPHDADDSGLPATVFHFTLRNQGNEKLRIDLAGWMQNATSFYSAKPADGTRRNRVEHLRNSTCMVMDFVPTPPNSSTRRPDILVEDFEKGYNGWRVEGEAFGREPVSRSVIPPYQGDVGGEGARVVNSHASAPSGSLESKDNQTGRLISPAFRIQRRFLSFYVGGGRRTETGIKLRVDGKTVRSTSGHNNNRMRLETFDIAEFEGRDAILEIFDDASGGWGNIGVDHIVQTDEPKSVEPLQARPDFGSMAFGVLGSRRGVRSIAGLGDGSPIDAIFSSDAGSGAITAWAPVGALVKTVTIAPGQSAEVRFVLAWFFPKTTLPVPDAAKGNFYASRFNHASAVFAYLTRNLDRLESLTRLWRDTWYHGSTLPHWFLERTFINTSILATTTSHRFASGRFWGWEGIGCCEGTCTHVWHYAQAPGRIFPEIERDQRERVDFGAGFDQATGSIRHRGEGTGPAIDGHCGRILGAWREHQTSSDDGFLKRLWPRIKLAAEYILNHDRDGDGILDGAQENTLDAAWYGQIAWITSLSLAALRAAEEMAREMGDSNFASRCRSRFEQARAAVESRLFNGEFFIQIADPKRERSLGTYEACHIDQVHGQSWAWQVGLGRVLDREKTLSALRSLWKYNFTTDVGPFRRKYTAGRPYALSGDGGLIMTSNPKLIPNVYGLPSWQIGYFNECMSGFEHQAASHMMAEGMVLEALAITRAIHDRYHPGRRNPFNEIECSDHYARAMASYGTFISACGFECHGPRGHIRFAPRLSPDDFAAPFTAAVGWGSYRQRRTPDRQTHELEVRYGLLRLESFGLELKTPTDLSAERSVTVLLGRQRIPAKLVIEKNRCEVRFARRITVSPKLKLSIEIARVA